jgi:hypothetical protein
MTEQKDGCYPRLNGSMIQSQQYNGMIISLVGKVMDTSTFQAADGTNLTLNTEYVQDGLVPNPDMCVEIVGQVQDATTVSVCISMRLFDGVSSFCFAFPTLYQPPFRFSVFRHLLRVNFHLTWI